MIPLGDESPRKTIPVVTYCLIAANVLSFIASWRLMAGTGLGLVENKWALTPAHFSVVALFTSMFLHVGFFHLAGNMIYLWVFGDNVEDVLGHVEYLVFYVAMGMLAGLGYYASDPHSPLPAVGASGAISGVLGAYAVLFPRSRIKVLWFVSFYGRIFSMRAAWLLALYFVLQVGFAVVSHIMQNVSGLQLHVAYWAHIAGFACGLGTTALLLRLKLIKRPDWAEPALTRAFNSMVADRQAAQGGAKTPVITGVPGRTGITRYVEWGGAASAGGIHYSSASSRVVEQWSLPRDPRARLEVALKAFSSGDVRKAINVARVELQPCAAGAADASAQPAKLSALAALGDAFYRAKIYGVASALYGAYIAQAAKDDEYLPEVKLRAGVTAARYLRAYDLALPLLDDAAQSHQQSERAEIAGREAAAVREALDRVVVETGSALVAGPCVAVRRTSSPIDISQVGKLVSKAVGKPLAEITRLLHTSTGIVATDIDPMKAKSLAIQLQEAGIPVLVIPAEKLVALPAAKNVREARVAKEGLEFRVGAKESQVRAKKYSEVFYASAGLVTFEKSDAAPGAPEAFFPGETRFGYVPDRTIDWGAGLSPKGGVTGVKTVLDIFTLAPFECYRIVDGETAFPEGPGATPGLRGRNLPGAAADLLAFGAPLPCNDGLLTLALDPSARRWRGLTFDSAGDFERYNYWRLQLEQYG